MFNRRCGIQGCKRNSFAAQQTAEYAAESQKHGVKEVDVEVNGPGAGRETAIRAIQSAVSSLSLFAT